MTADNWRRSAVHLPKHSLMGVPSTKDFVGGFLGGASLLLQP